MLGISNEIEVAAITVDEKTILEIRIFLKTDIFFPVFKKNKLPHVAYSNRFRPSTRTR